MKQLSIINGWLVSSHIRIRLAAVQSYRVNGTSIELTAGCQSYSVYASGEQDLYAEVRAMIAELDKHFGVPPDSETTN